MEKKPKLSYEERKNLAFREGKRYVRIVCPLCNRSQSLVNKEMPFQTQNDPEVIQIRLGIGGRGTGGFFKKEDESIFMSDLRNVDPVIYVNLKEEINKLFHILHREV